MKIAFIGGGNMATALVGGLIKRGVPGTDIYVIDTNESKRTRLTEDFGIQTGASLNEALSEYEVVVLAVKPQALKECAYQLAPYLKDQLVISVAVGVRAADISRWLNHHKRIVRAMPNTPSLIGQGVTGATTFNHDKADRELAQQVLEPAGEVIWLENESQIDALSAVSGSGPAYVFYFIEALERAAHELGFNDSQSRQMALKTFAGAVQLALQSDESPGQLRERVTSKGGTTAAALNSFNQNQVKEKIVSGTFAALARAKEMSDEFGRD